MCVGPELLLAGELLAGGAAAGGAAAGAGALSGFTVGTGLLGGAELLGGIGGAELFGGLAGAGGFGALGGAELLGGMYGLEAGVGGLAGSELLGGTFGLEAGSLGSGLGAASGFSVPAFGGDLAALGGLEGAALGGAGASSPLSSLISGYTKYASPISSALSGVTGLQKQAELRRLSKLAMRQGDPWGTSGGRALADAQLQELLRDPSGVAQNDPAYKLGIQGAQRANAQFGQDSGAMSVAGANASTDWYNTRLAQLGGLAGTGFNPQGAAQIGIEGVSAANNLLSSSLGSIGYGMAGSGAGAGGLTPQQQLQLIALAGRRGG